MSDALWVVRAGEKGRYSQDFLQGSFIAVGFSELAADDLSQTDEQSLKARATNPAERIYALVKARGNAGHELEALFDLSWTYYDAGEMKQCARVDSIAVTVADGDPGILLSQRGRARQYLAFDYSVLGDHRMGVPAPDGGRRPVLRGGDRRHSRPRRVPGACSP